MQEFNMEKMGLEYIKFMKNSFLMWMESIATLGKQGEKMLDMMLKQESTASEEWGNIIREWTNNFKKAREQFQSTVEENLTKLENFLTK
jgi:hypothetical protein